MLKLQHSNPPRLTRQACWARPSHRLCPCHQYFQLRMPWGQVVLPLDSWGHLPGPGPGHPYAGDARNQHQYLQLRMLLQSTPGTLEARMLRTPGPLAGHAARRVRG